MPIVSVLILVVVAILLCEPSRQQGMSRLYRKGTFSRLTLVSLKTVLLSLC